MSKTLKLDTLQDIIYYAEKEYERVMREERYGG
jgi:hypothetical protein